MDSMMTFERAADGTIKFYCPMTMRAYIATHISDGDIEAKMGAYANPQAKTRAQARVMCADALLAELAKS